MAETYIDNNALGTTTSGQEGFTSATPETTNVLLPGVKVGTTTIGDFGLGNQAPSASRVEEQITPPVITSKQAVEDTQKNIEKTQADIQQIESTQTAVGETPTKTPTESKGTMTIEEAKERFGTNFSGVHFDESNGKYWADEVAQLRAADAPEEEIETAKFESSVDTKLDNINKELDTLSTTRSTMNKQLIENIKAQYEVRKTQMKDLNKRTLEAARKIGIKTGRQRYAGLMESQILSNEEAAGISRLASLDAEANSLILQAQMAMNKEDYEALADKRMSLEKVREQELEAWNSLQKTQAEANAKMTERLNQADLAIAVSTLQKMGITDPAEQLIAANQLGYALDAESLEKIQKVFNFDNPNIKAIRDIYQAAVNNGAPADILDSILDSNNSGEALRSAGDYAQNASGMPGEYNRYKLEMEAMGLTPMSFNDYQTEDANRKRQIINMNSGGFTTQEAATFDRIVSSYNDDKAVRALIGAQKAALYADSIIANPTSVTKQLGALYSLVKNLDPESAVREGEISLAEATQSYVERFSNAVSRLSSGVVTSPEAAVRLAQEIKELVEPIAFAERKVTNMYRARAKGFSTSVGSSFEDYLDTVQDLNTNDELIERAQNAKVTLDSFVVTNPDKAEKAAQLSEANFTDAEILEYFNL